MARIILIILLFGIVVFQIPGEKVPINEGTYGHGIFFRQVAIEFVDVIDQDSYNIWQLQHIMPFALVHVIYVILGFELEPSSLMSGMLILNLLFLALAVFWYLEVIRKLRFSGALEALAFILIFFNFLVLREVWYNPFTTDMAALCLALGQVNYFIRYEKNKLFLVSLIGAFVSPFLLPLGLLLMLIPADKLVLKEQSKNNPLLTGLWVLVFLVAMVSLGVYTRRFSTSWGESLAFLSSLLAAGAFLFWIGQKSPVDWTKTWKLIGKKLQSERILLFFGGLFVISLLLWLLSGSNSNVSLTALADAFFGALFRFPFDFLAGHLMFFGLIAPLSLVFLPRILKESALLGFGFAIGMLLLLLFSLHPNSSTLVPFLPLLFLALLKAIRRYNLLWKDVFILAVINLLLSMFWVRLNVPGMEEAFDIGNVSGFPAQRYWMHFGQAQDILVMGIVLLLFVLLIILLEKGRRRYVKTSR